MKRLLILLTVVSGVCSVSFAGDVIVTLKNEKLDLPNANFYIADVIDSRVEKDNIGVAMTGVFNIKRPVQMKGGLKDSLLEYFNCSLPKTEGKTPIILNISEFVVTEQTRASGEYAIADVAMSFCLVKDDTIGEVYSTHAHKEKRSLWDVTTFHEHNIRAALNDCVISFASGKWSEQNVAFVDRETFEYDMATKQFAATAGKKGSNKNEKHSKVYLGLTLPYQTVQGLDGNSVLSNDDEVMLVTKLRSGAGVGLVLGAIYPNNSKSNPMNHAIEMSYAISNHRAEWMYWSGDASYRVFSMDWMPHFRADKKTQPFLDLGFYYHSLSVKDAAFDFTSATTGDAMFSGFGFTIGGGVSHYLSNHVMVKGALKYRAGSFIAAKGVQGHLGRINDALNVSGLVPSVDVAYVF